jgi:hypothetical protein
MYASNGLTITITLSQAIQISNLPSTFSCCDYLTFGGANNTASTTCMSVSMICMWIDRYTISLVLTGAGYVTLGTEVSLALNGNTAKLLSVCDHPSTVSCPRIKVMRNAQTAVLGPIYPAQVQVVIAAPSLISTCNELQLDLTNSFGNAGQPWLNYSVQVQASVMKGTTAMSYVVNQTAGANLKERIGAAFSR